MNAEAYPKKQSMPQKVTSLVAQNKDFGPRVRKWKLLNLVDNKKNDRDL
jgi:hypothetical protein